MTTPRFNVSTVDSQITLRPLGPEHLDIWWEVVNHNRAAWSPTSTYAQSQCATYEDTLASLTREAKRVQAGERLNRGIWFQGNLRGRLLVVPDRKNRSAEIGFAVDTRAQGNGIARRAASYMIQHLTEEGYVRIWLTCLPENTGSIRVAKALGMQLEGRMRNAKIVDGVPRDKLLYALAR